MRLIGAASIVFTVALTFVISGFGPATTAQQLAGRSGDDAEHNQRDDGERRHRDGQAIFRYDTFGDEQLWTDVLRMHEAIATVDPATALAVGLKVDVEALPRDDHRRAAGRTSRSDQPRRHHGIVAAECRRRRQGHGQRGGPADQRRHHLRVVPLHGRQLLRAGHRQAAGRMGEHRSECRRDRRPVAGAGRCHQGRVHALGPGQYDPRHHAFDGTNLLSLNSPSLPIVIPSIYGLKGVGFETFTADGPISYWNSYVGVGQMGGHGNFSDPRIGLFITQTPDLVTPKLAALLDYQLSLRTPEPPKGSFDQAGGEARQAAVSQTRPDARRCHQSPNFTDVLSGPKRTVPFLHDPAEVGMDPALCRQDRHRKIPDDAVAGTLAAPAVFP